ncbi:2-phosphosulfolactate phosphatase [Nocardia asteroides]|uniref:2-phosphosulfolactate phosphatase n=1 Tax=Nocardia asteroides TaxID=1824 RepID=UPI001E530379|nr:2-phosphosulfolactate phosphatase [Nocardia asteroides]UGT56086.1 2-phosphosulfolactate phosphatase [Nocardia asteroides]
MSSVPEWSRQRGFGIGVDWGAAGAAALGPGAAALVVVDVLSFTTSVSVATGAGTVVYPYRWRDDSARAFAERHDAALAVGRRAVDTDQPWSLSPAALRRAPFTARLVLPSPNGSAIAAGVTGVPVVAGCLRNARAVAAWLRTQGWGTPARPVAIVAAGEHWPGSGGVRPALEDWLGAGAVAAALLDLGATDPSPEARTAAASFTATPDVPTAVADCASGRELISGGFAEDVAVATELDTEPSVPVLVDGAFAAQPAR